MDHLAPEPAQAVVRAGCDRLQRRDAVSHVRPDYAARAPRPVRRDGHEVELRIVARRLLELLVGVGGGPRLRLGVIEAAGEDLAAARQVGLVGHGHDGEARGQGRGGDLVMGQDGVVPRAGQPEPVAGQRGDQRRVVVQRVGLEPLVAGERRHGVFDHLVQAILRARATLEEDLPRPGILGVDDARDTPARRFPHAHAVFPPGDLLGRAGDGVLRPCPAAEHRQDVVAAILPAFEHPVDRPIEAGEGFNGQVPDAEEVLVGTVRSHGGGHGGPLSRSER